MGRKNPIIDAFDENELEAELEGYEPNDDELDEMAEDDRRQYQADAEDDNFSDEEVLDQAEARYAANRAAKRARRGRARDTRRRDTVEQLQARSRAPVVERAEEWAPANSLEAPPPRAGMEQRWIRFQNGDKPDPRNWSRKVREGWKPRPVSTVPEGFAPPTMRHGTAGEVIGVEDLILCERSERIGASRKRHFENKTIRQAAAVRRQHVDKVQKNGHEIAVTDKRHEPTVGRGTRRPRVQD